MSSPGRAFPLRNRSDRARRRRHVTVSSRFYFRNEGVLDPQVRTSGTMKHSNIGACGVSYDPLAYTSGVRSMHTRSLGLSTLIVRRYGALGSVQGVKASVISWNRR